VRVVGGHVEAESAGMSELTWLGCDVKAVSEMDTTESMTERSAREVMERSRQAFSKLLLGLKGAL
jgi:hypothetical protein